MNQPQFLKGKVDVSNITWTDVFEKIEYDRQQKTFTETVGATNTIACHGEYIPQNMIPLFNHMKKHYRMQRFHQYTSLNVESSTFGYHNDKSDVIIVPIIGKMGYRVEGLGNVKMKPGDILYIPKYVFHEPILYEPRATLSFS